jgi:O-antigen/teichoic acid export membrane protein
MGPQGRYLTQNGPMRLTRWLTRSARHRTAGPQSGARSGALLAAASGTSIVAAYVFLLAAGRILGSEDYGSLAALLGLLTVVLIPAGALQMAVSREISRRDASDDPTASARVARGTLRLSLLGTVPLLVVSSALAAPLSNVLHIDSVGLVALALATLSTALVFPVALGVLQGQQRFHALAALYLFPWLVRLLVFGIVAEAGYRVGGAIFATMVSAVAGTVLAIVLIRGVLAGPGSLSRAELRAFLVYLGPVAAGLIGIALLTHIDVLIVKARFSGDAGAYAAASAFARVGFFLPATILTVLFPRTAARQARGEETEDILGRSLLATAAFCGALALVYAAAGVGLVSLTFGPDFAKGGEVLAPFALAIGLFSLANVLVGYHLSRGESRYAWIVAGGVVAQFVALALFPSSLRGVVWTNVAIGVLLLAAHEVFVGSSRPALRAGLRRLSDRSATRLRSAGVEGFTVFLGATAFICVLFAPVVVHLGSTIVGSLGSDSTASVWWFWQLNHESGYHLLGMTHHTLTGAPLGWDEGNGLNLQWLLPYYPGFLATKVVGEVAAYNLVVLSGYVLSGVVMYAVARYLGCKRFVSAWAGLVFIVFPWHLARAEHASLVHIEVLALLILTLVAATREPSWPRFGLVGAATLACWLTSGYYGAEALVTAAAFGLGAALTLNRRVGLRLAGGLTACALAATALIAVGSFTSGVNRGAGLHREARDLTNLGLRPQDALVPADGNLIVGGQLRSWRLSHLHGTNITEGSDYLGWLTIALAVIWLIVAWRRRSALRPATAGLAAAVIVGLVFAAPSPITIFGKDVWMPSRFLWEVVPAFRVPSRWTPLVMAALVPLAALGLQVLWDRFSRSRVVPIAIVGAAALVSFLELAIAPAENRFRTGPVPAEYKAVEASPQGILAEYPLGSSDIFRFWQREHKRRLLNAFPGAMPADEARLVLLDPASPGTAPALRLLGVTAIAIHEHAIVDVEVSPRTPTAVDGYKLLARTPDGASVWEVTARPAAAFVTLPGGFGKPRLDGNVLVYPLDSPAGVGVIQLRSKRPGVVSLVFDANPPSGATRNIRVADSHKERAFTVAGPMRFTLDVRVPRGLSQLLVKTDPAAKSEADAVLLSVPRARTTAGAPTLQTDLVSADPGF